MYWLSIHLKFKIPLLFDGVHCPFDTTYHIICRQFRCNKPHHVTYQRSKWETAIPWYECSPHWLRVYGAFPVIVDSFDASCFWRNWTSHPVIRWDDRFLFLSISHSVEISSDWISTFYSVSESPNAESKEREWTAHHLWIWWDVVLCAYVACGGAVARDGASSASTWWRIPNFPQKTRWRETWREREWGIEMRYDITSCGLERRSRSSYY